MPSWVIHMYFEINRIVQSLCLNGVKFVSLFLVFECDQDLEYLESLGLEGCLNEEVYLQNAVSRIGAGRSLYL